MAEASQPPKPKSKVKNFGPQPGPQSLFLTTPADVAIYGGAAGGGKTFGLLLEALRNVGVPTFGAVIFRSTSPQIRAKGGLWDEANRLFPLAGATGTVHNLKFQFPSGATVQFAHLQHEKNRYDWQGAQIPLVGFDELTHFTADQFFYLMARARSMSGVAGYVRATCNPDPDSFVAGLVAWYVNEDGFAIPERSGIIRWFVRVNDELVWADTREELVARFGVEAEPTSFTFIAADIYDNKELLAKDPTYLAKLKALSHVERMRLLHGNWKVRATAGSYFKRGDFRFVDAAPVGIPAVRYWDRAATEKRPDNDPDWTAGVKVGRDDDGTFYVMDVVRLQAGPFAVEKAVHNTAEMDGRRVDIVLEQAPAGEAEVAHYIRALAGYGVRAEKVTRDKETRAKPASSQAGAGNVCLVRGAWNEAFLLELENFPKGKHDDQVDAFGGAVNALAGKVSFAPEGVRMATTDFRGRRFTPRRL